MFGVVSRGDREYRDSSPLEMFGRIDSVRYTLLRKRGMRDGMTTRNWRGYIAYWRIIDGRLYLDHAVDGYRGKTTLDMEGILESDGTGYYPADFFSGEIWIGTESRCIRKSREKKEVFEFRNGRLIRHEMLRSHYKQSSNPHAEYEFPIIDFSLQKQEIIPIFT